MIRSNRLLGPKYAAVRTAAAWLLAITALTACVGSGDDGEEPDPEGFTLGPTPHIEDFDDAVSNLDSALQDEGGAIAEDALSGTFALYTASATLVDTVVFGTHKGGGVNFRLVTRTFDDDERAYTQTSTLCGGYNYEVGGVVTTVVDGAYQKVPESVLEDVRLDPERGIYLSNGHVQLWGIQDLPDPLTTPLPASLEESEMAPHADRIYDMDDDGLIGISLFVDGEVEAGSFDGEVYAVQRKRVDLVGVATSPDRAIGYTYTTYESLALGSDPDVLQSIYEGSATTHPDARQSFFEELRIDADASCDDVLALIGGDDHPGVAPW